MASRSINDLDPKLQPLAQMFLDQCATADVEAIITQTYRSAEEQDADYAKGRTAPGPRITDARGGESPHNCTLPDGTPAARAFDFALYSPGGDSLDWQPSDKQWQTAIGVVKSLNLISGSTFPDPDNDHAELPDWHSA